MMDHCNLTMSTLNNVMHGREYPIFGRRYCQYIQMSCLFKVLAWMLAVHLLICGLIISFSLVYVNPMSSLCLTGTFNFERALLACQPSACSILLWIILVASLCLVALMAFALAPLLLESIKVIFSQDPFVAEHLLPVVVYASFFHSSSVWKVFLSHLDYLFIFEKM